MGTCLKKSASPVFSCRACRSEGERRYATATLRQAQGGLPGLVPEASETAGQRAARPALSGRGFTLLEVLVALAIMAVAVVYLMQLSSSNLRTIAASQGYMDALVQAETKMREITEADRLEETTWQEQTPEGRRVEVSVTEALKERAERLPVKLLQIEMVFSWEEALRKRSVTLKTLKMVDRINGKATGA